MGGDREGEVGACEVELGYVRWSHGKCIFSINIQSDIHGDKHAGAYVARNPGTRYLTPTA